MEKSQQKTEETCSVWRWWADDVKDWTKKSVLWVSQDRLWFGQDCCICLWGTICRH